MSRFKNKYIYLFFRNSNNSELTWFLIMLLVTASGPNVVVFFFLKKEKKKEEKKPQIPPNYVWWPGLVLERIRSVSFIKPHFIRMNVLFQPKYIAAHHHCLSWLSKSKSTYNASCHWVAESKGAKYREVQVITKDKAYVPKQKI